MHLRHTLVAAMAALNVHRVEVDFRRLMLRCEQFASAEGARAWNVTERARFAMVWPRSDRRTTGSDKLLHVCVRTLQFVKSLSERLDQMREEVERNPVAAEALPPSKLREYARRVANMGDVRQHQHQHQQQMQEQPHAAVVRHGTVAPIFPLISCYDASRLRRPRPWSAR